MGKHSNTVKNLRQKLLKTCRGLLTEIPAFVNEGLVVLKTEVQPQENEEPLHAGIEIINGKANLVLVDTSKFPEKLLPEPAYDVWEEELPLETLAELTDEIENLLNTWRGK